MGNVRYDVIVIGGGPAGLMASRICAESGLKTVLIEKEKRLGVKPCGEGVLIEALEEAGLKVDASYAVNRVAGGALISPDESVRLVVENADKKFGVYGYIVDKPKFLNALLLKAYDAGVDVWLRTRARNVRVREEHVEVEVTGWKTTTVQGEVVVGADGFASVVARDVFGYGKQELIPALQYKMKNCELEREDFIYVYVGRKVAPLGYLWVFPKGDGEANVGLGIRKAPLKYHLDKFIESHPEMFRKAKIVEVDGAAVPIGGPRRSLVSDRAVLCGDAAGHVVPISGEGIRPAIVAGKIAGEAICKAFDEENFSRKFLKTYQDRFDEKFGKLMKWALKARKTLEVLKDPEIIRLINFMDEESIIELALKLRVWKFAKKLMRDPVFAVSIAAKLLRA